MALEYNQTGKSVSRKSCTEWPVEGVRHPVNKSGRAAVTMKTATDCTERKVTTQ